MKRWTAQPVLALPVLAFAALALLSTAPLAADPEAARVPGEQWQRYVDPAEAGFDGDRLEAARKTWEALPSSAFLVISNGAVVADWGQTGRRFMCHSVRKSFLSALFGIYWDRGEIELNKTMADVGIDEAGEGLLEIEKQARIIDLLKARSGVFHPAAYAGRTDSRPRGSEGPGRFFAYNNWDFNTLAAVLEKETGATVFEAFDEHFGRPLQMEDWRVSDGYFHYELDKSIYPAYPFRMSARDAARFGLLFAREGKWGDRRILSRHWVRRSTALYSIDDEVFGYGFMWWIAREPRFEGTGFAAALGVGNQMILALPDLDMVIVNRANTYQGESTPTGPLLDLVEAVIQARTGKAVAEPKLVPLEAAGETAPVTTADAQRLDELAGEWPYPPAPLGLPERTQVKITPKDGHLLVHSPASGTFLHYLQPDGWLVEEDSLDRYLPIRDENGKVTGIADASAIARAALLKYGTGDPEGARALLALVEGEDQPTVEIVRVLSAVLAGQPDADASARRLLETFDPRELGGRINGAGYQLLQAGHPKLAQQVFELNTRLFPEVANVWDSLAESHMAQGNDAEAIRFYEKALEVNPDFGNAKAMLERLKGGEQ